MAKKSCHRLISFIPFEYILIQLVSDPYLQGRIACCNVLSDLYAMGISEIGTILMVLGVTKEMKEQDRDICTGLMVKGFDDCAKEAGTSITGGQTIYSSAPIIGGTAISSVHESSFIIPVNSNPGDLLVLTKPIGTQLVTTFNQWQEKDSLKWQELKKKISREDLVEIYMRACDNMATLNKEASSLMMKLKATACTDVTGFGLLGHAHYLAQVQKKQVQFLIEQIPIYKGTKGLDGIGSNFKIGKGLSAETSGGLLISLPQDYAYEFVSSFKSLYNRESWIIGRVISSSDKSAVLSENVEIVEV